MKTVLFVDDEPLILDTLRRLFKARTTEWAPAFVSNAQEALAELGRARYNAIVTDLSLWGMSGQALLHRARAEHPDTVRLVFTGAMQDDGLSCVVEGAHGCICKPCDIETLIARLSRVCALQDLLRQPRLRALIGAMGVLPAAPAAYTRFFELIRSPETGPEELAAVIASDVGLSASLLRLVNSAFFGLNRRVEDIPQAVKLLGLRTIRGLAMGMKLFSQFTDLPEMPGFAEALGQHACAVAMLSQSIVARAGDRALTEPAFLAGLLHDVGKLALAANLKREYAAVIQQARRRGQPDWQAEVDAFGASHAEVGACLLALWNFGHETIEAVAYHHMPAASTHPQFSPLTAVHLADAASCDSKTGPRSVLDEEYLAVAAPQWRQWLQSITARKDVA